MTLVRVLGAYSTGDEAFENLPQVKPKLTIMDIGLPGMTGTEVVARLTADGYEGDFIMYTVFDHDKHLFRALEIGAKGYILKEEGPAGVEAAVDEYRRDGAPMSRAIARRVIQSFNQKRPIRLSANFEDLTAQENTILELLSQGLQNKEIASKLAIKEGTVKQHNVRIYRKLSVNNRSEAMGAYRDHNKT